MRNWADLSCLIIVFTGTMGALGGAREGNAGIVMTLLFALGGFLVGCVLARVSGTLAYSALNSKRLTVGMALGVYGMIPVFFLLLTMFGTFELSMWLARCIL